MLGCEKGRASWPMEGPSLQRGSDGHNSQRGGSRCLCCRVSKIPLGRYPPRVLTTLSSYGDGSIRIWDSRIATVIISFNGHKSAVTTLAFDKDGVRLASGAKDTDIIVWDLVAEIGLFKLRGHKDQITGLHYLHTGERFPSTDRETDGDESLMKDLADGDSQHAGYLLSTSKDALIKIWDVGSQHCIETHVAQSNGECWSMGVSADQSGVITAGNDGELKVWSIDLVGLARAAAEVNEVSQKGLLRECGTLFRQGKDRTTAVNFHPSGTYVAAHGSDKSVELWRIRSESEVQKTMSRKRKRRREKAQVAAGQDGKLNGSFVDEEEDAEQLSAAHITDVIVPYLIVRTTGKLRSMAWAGRRLGKSLRLLLATTNNQLEMYDITTKQKDKASRSDEPPDYTRPFSVDIPGHRTDVRSLSLSSDDRMLASACNGSLKIWNVRTQSCIRTLDCGYALCATFLPGDKIVIVGNRNGELEIFDIASSTLIETFKAHEGPIWTLDVHPDGRSMATGSADKSAKFYNFEVIQE